MPSCSARAEIVHRIFLKWEKVNACTVRIFARICVNMDVSGVQISHSWQSVIVLPIDSVQPNTNFSSATIQNTNFSSVNGLERSVCLIHYSHLRSVKWPPEPRFLAFLPNLLLDSLQEWILSFCEQKYLVNFNNEFVINQRFHSFTFNIDVWYTYDPKRRARVKFILEIAVPQNPREN